MRKIENKKMIYMITSVGQLNFFCWAMQNRVIEYCISNFKKIDNHYNTVQNMPSPINGKRRKLTEKYSSTIQFKNISTIMSYENNFHRIVINKND